MKVFRRLSPLAAGLISCSPQRASTAFTSCGWFGTARGLRRSASVVACFGSSKPSGGLRVVADKRLVFPRKSVRYLPPAPVALFSIGAPDSDSCPDVGQNALQHSPVARDLRILGVCGGIGSGKSLACKILVSDLGCAAHIDADKLSHDVYAPGSSALKEISEEFGSDVLQENGEINRKKLGSIVFADSKAMSKLESIVWPHARDLLENRLKELACEIKQSQNVTEPSFVVVEAAVLIDAGWDDLFDAIWVVRAPATTTASRLVSDRGMDRQDASVRIDAQQSRRGIGNLQEELDRGAITAVIENNGSIDDLKENLAQKLLDPSSWKNKVSVELNE